jgi:sodium/bile acid cotransporter 7
MRTFLARHWFLLVLTGGISLAYGAAGALRPVVDRISPRWVVATILFLMAWGLEGQQLWNTLLRPGPALFSILISYGALPLLAWLAGHLLVLPDLRLGLMIVATVPCTLASSVLWTRMGGGNEATALLAVVLSTSLGWLAAPLWLTQILGLPHSPDMGLMMGHLLLLLIVPLLLAQTTRRLPGVASMVLRYKRQIGVLARLLILSVILKAAVRVVDANAGAARAGGGFGIDPLLLLGTAGVCLGTHLTALCLGLWGSTALGVGRREAIAVAFTSSQKTLPVSLFLFDTYYALQFPLGVFPLAFYHVGQLIVDTFIADRLLHKDAITAVEKRKEIVSPGEVDRV